MDEVLPTHHRPREMAPVGYRPRRWLGVYAGDVLGSIPPNDERSQTKKFWEYRVAVQVFDGETSAVIEVPHALLGNPFAGLADRATWRLRGDDKAGAKGRPGAGSKVLVQFIGGDPNNAVIVSGYRDQNDKDTPADPKGDLGGRLEVTYNGLEVRIDEKGALRVRRGGATKPDGTLDEARSPKDQVGALVELDAKGGLRLAAVREGKEEQSVVLDHEKKTLSVMTKSGLAIEVVDGPVTVKAKGKIEATSAEGPVTATAEKGDLVLSAPKGKIRLGKGAQEKAVLGDKLAGWLGELCKAIQQQTHPTGVGPSGPPINAAVFAQLEAKLQTLLSTAVTVKPSP